MLFFNQWFGRFLASRHTRHLFRRRVILESLSKEGRAAAVPDQLNQQLVQQARQDLPDLLAQLNTRKEGLSDAEADAIRARVGPNEVEHEKPMPWWLHLWLSYKNPFNLLLSVLIASVFLLFLPFLPMLPLQLLVQNLLYDVSQIAIPFDNVDAELVSKPLKWNPDDIRRFMIFFGSISSIFDITTFVVMWYVFKANSLENQTLFQSGWFVVGLLTQTLIVHMIRTPKIPFIESRAAWPLLAMTLLIMVVGIFLPMGPLASYFKLEALPLAYFGWLAAILLSYAGLTTLMKRYYIRRFGWQ